MGHVVMRFQDVTKSFFGVPAVKNVSFELREGRILGLVGENGAGKSTLMNLLGGVLQADLGHIEVDGKRHEPRTPADASRAGVAFIHQELNLFANLTIAENIFLGRYPLMPWLPFINTATINTQTKEILRSIGLARSPSTPVEQLSPGERQLVEIGKALGANANIIILDEPTTSLTDRETQRLFKVLRQLRDEGRSLIYISHILEDVLDLSDDIAVMRDGVLVSAAPREEFTKERMISLMVGRDLEQLYPRAVSATSTECVLEVRNVSQAGVVHDVSFDLHRGEVLGVFGLMGSGRTELARILFGLDSARSGVVSLSGQPIARLAPRTCIGRKMAFVTEDRRDEGLLMDESIAGNLSLVALPRLTSAPFRFVRNDRLFGETQEVAAALRIKSGDPALQRPVKSLSGGNQQKVVIGKWVITNPKVFIIDEPTRGIDVGAKFEVYSIVKDLAAKGTGVLFISSELEELIGVCDRIMVMRNGEIVSRFEHEEFNHEQILGAAFGEVQHA